MPRSVGMSSDGAGAAKEPGHLEVRTSSSQGTGHRDALSDLKMTFFSRHPQNTGRQRCWDRFTVKI